MIILVFLVLFVISGFLAWYSLRDLKAPTNSGAKIKRKEKKQGLFGVIKLPPVPHRHGA